MSEVEQFYLFTDEIVSDLEAINFHFLSAQAKSINVPRLST